MRTVAYCLLAFALLAACSCRLMAPTIAESVIQVDSNCKELLGNYNKVLDGGEMVEDIEHEKALLSATLVLTNELKLTAESELKNDKTK